LSLERQINIYIALQKTWMNHSSKFQMYSIEKITPPSTACLTSLFGNDNYIIILLQSTMIYILMNIIRINNKTLILFSISYNDVINSKNTISLYLVNKYTLSNLSHWNSTSVMKRMRCRGKSHNSSLFVFICQAMVENTILV
jgi:hypothetical protein